MSSNGAQPPRGAGRGASLASLASISKQLELAKAFAPFPTLGSQHSDERPESGLTTGNSDSSDTKPRGFGRGKLMNDATSLSVPSQPKASVSSGPLGLSKLMNILKNIERQKLPSSSTSETDSTAEAEEVLSKDSSSDLAEESALNKKGTKGM